jgi:glucose-1-phosphate cytidylyltransferase
MKNFSRSNNKTAVILCGGKGSRLGLLGKKIPKSMVKIHNYPIIWYIINILSQNSFNHLILPIGYKGHLIEKYFKNNNSFKNLNLEIVRTGTDTSIAKRIFRIKKKIKSKNFLLLNGDAIFDFDVQKIFNKHEINKFDVTFIGCSERFKYGIVAKEKNRIIGFERDVEFNSINKKNNKSLIGYVYSGISILNSELLKINFKNFSNFEKKFYPKIIKKNKSNFEQIDGFWHSIDNTKDIDNLNKKDDKAKYDRIDRIIKKIKKNEKQFLEK